MFQDCRFGMVKYKGNKYQHDIVVHVDGSVTARRKEISRRKYGTSHKLSQEEIEPILDEEPDIIIVGAGVHGALRLGEVEIEPEIMELPTCDAIKEYNRLIESGKRVAAIIHVTC